MFFPFGIVALTLAIPLAFTIDPITTLECHRRQYSYKVQQTDSNGHLCWDQVNVMSCWGRCDSNEIADWKFPYKRSHHPVCMHDSTQEKEVILRNCDENADPEIRSYKFQEAATCSCSYCKSSQASCEGLRYRGARRAPGQSKKNVKRVDLLLNSAYSSPVASGLLQKLHQEFPSTGNLDDTSAENFKKFLMHLRNVYENFDELEPNINLDRFPSSSSRRNELHSEPDLKADLLKLTYYDPEELPTDRGSDQYFLKRIISQLPKRDAEYFEPGGENDQ